MTAVIHLLGPRPHFLCAKDFFSSFLVFFRLVNYAYVWSKTFCSDLFHLVKQCFHSFSSVLLCVVCNSFPSFIGQPWLNKFSQFLLVMSMLNLDSFIISFAWWTKFWTNFMTLFLRLINKHEAQPNRVLFFCSVNPCFPSISSFSCGVWSVNRLQPISHCFDKQLHLLDGNREFICIRTHALDCTETRVLTSPAFALHWVRAGQSFCFHVAFNKTQLDSTCGMGQGSGDVNYDHTTTMTTLSDSSLLACFQPHGLKMFVTAPTIVLFSSNHFFLSFFLSFSQSLSFFLCLSLPSLSFSPSLSLPPPLSLSFSLSMQHQREKQSG